VLTIVAGLILPAVLGCLMPAAAQAQTMQCCVQLTCVQGHQMQACCSTMAPTDSSQSTPQLRVSLTAPVLPTDARVSSEVQNAVAFGSAAVTSTPQHSPPELYTLHLALLI
jgi:hypothetical protein